ncbi:MAG: hypothetical protein M1822_006009 [Bathelium mastoideum]|nr:MAG: hypothetical protein M1822_006009 [Bathelium mastoideum]
MRLAETIINLGNPDITHALLPVSLWASVEPAVGLVIVCMPVLPRLFNNTSPKAATFSYGTSGSHGNARSKPSVNSTLINDVYTEIDGGNWRSDSLQRLAPKVTGQQAISMDTIQTDAAYRSPEEFSADPKRDRWMKQQSKSEIMKTVSVEQHRD